MAEPLLREPLARALRDHKHAVKDDGEFYFDIDIPLHIRRDHLVGHLFEDEADAILAALAADPEVMAAVTVARWLQLGAHATAALFGEPRP